MLPGSFTPLFVGPCHEPPDGERRVRNFIQYRRFFGEGYEDGSGPPGMLARALWAYFRCGGEAARVLGLRLPTPATPLTEALEAIGDSIARDTPPLLVPLGVPWEQLAQPPFGWPDPSPLVLLDAPWPRGTEPEEMERVAREIYGAGLGRFRLVMPRGFGSAPVQGPSRPGTVSAAALAAALVGRGGVARIAGAGLSFPKSGDEATARKLTEAGVILLRRGPAGTLGGLGLPRLPRRSSAGRIHLDDSPFGPLVRYLQQELAHHVQEIWDSGLCRRVERDGMSALGRYFGRARGGYRVRCDEELNPPEQKERGVLVLEVALGPPLPLVREVVLRLSLR